MLECASLLLTGWGAGTTFTKGVDPSIWVITDGVDGEVAYVSIGTVHVTDVIFG